MEKTKVMDNVVEEPKEDVMENLTEDLPTETDSKNSKAGIVLLVGGAIAAGYGLYSGGKKIAKFSKQQFHKFQDWKDEKKKKKEEKMKDEPIDVELTKEETIDYEFDE